MKDRSFQEIRQRANQYGKKLGVTLPPVAVCVVDGVIEIDGHFNSIQELKILEPEHPEPDDDE